jgi:Ni/Fe-hydrogenase b-type cytochrome subunit
MASTTQSLPPVSAPPDAAPTVYRHRVTTRLWHWLNALTIFIMIGSGLGILNAHPRLYWGEYGANFDRPWLTLPDWPGWLTIPAHYNLAISRRWHLFFALVLGFALIAFLIVSLVNRHIQRDLRPRAAEVAPRNLWADVKAHLALRFHDPERPGAYNTLQKLSYFAVIFILLPLMLLTGLAMSPAMDAAWPWLLDVTGGRQSARSLHFIGMALIALFILVHLALVILADPINELKSMITGWWTVPEDEA